MFFVVKIVKKQINKRRLNITTKNQKLREIFKKVLNIYFEINEILNIQALDVRLN